MENYTVFEEVKHDEFKSFAQDQMSQESFYQKVYNLSMIFIALLFIGGTGYALTLFWLDENLFYMIQTVGGILVSFSILIFLHEFLHAVAYKIKGAKSLYFGAELSSFVFYVASNQEKFTGNQYKFIALFPFTIIIILSGILLIAFPQYFQLIFSILFVHHIFCGGDFAAVCFLQKHGVENILTFDSKEKQTTYFLKRA
jgi:hypothetical protein